MAFFPLVEITKVESKLQLQYYYCGELIRPIIIEPHFSPNRKTNPTNKEAFISPKRAHFCRLKSKTNPTIFVGGFHVSREKYGSIIGPFCKYRVTTIASLRTGYTILYIIPNLKSLPFIAQTSCDRFVLSWKQRDGSSSKSACPCPSSSVSTRVNFNGVVLMVPFGVGSNLPDSYFILL